MWIWFYLGWRSITGSNKVLKASSEELAQFLGDTSAFFWIKYEKAENFACLSGYFTFKFGTWKPSFIVNILFVGCMMLTKRVIDLD